MKNLFLLLSLCLTTHAFAVNKTQFDLDIEASSYIARALMGELANSYDGLEDFYGYESMLLGEQEALQVQGECSQQEKVCTLYFPQAVEVLVPTRFSQAFFTELPVYYVKDGNPFFKGVVLFNKLNAKERVFKATFFIQ
jgi:hypothetical protein